MDSSFTLQLDLTSRNDVEMLTEINRDGLYEKATSELVKNLLKPGDVFIDVGANIGYYSMLASRIVGEEGRIFAFEPVTANSGPAKGQYHLEQCPQHRGRAEGGLFSRYNAHALSFRYPRRYEQPSRGDFVHSMTQQVETVRLDTALDDLPVSLLKIDAEGAEREVFAARTASLQSPIARSSWCVQVSQIRIS